MSSPGRVLDPPQVGQSDRRRPPERVLVIAMKDAEAARAYMARAGFEGSVENVLRAVRRPLATRRLIGSLKATRVVFHSIDWSRETAPQLPQLASLLMPEVPVELADDTLAPPRPLSPIQRVTAPAVVLGHAVAGSARIAAEVRHARRLARVAAPRPGRRTDNRRVLAVWFGGLGSDVGGSVTHMSGILGGFRSHGYDVALLTNGPAPPQLAAAVDSVAIVEPAPRSSRLISDFARIGANPGVRRLGARLAGRDRPAFLYQRHRAFMTAGYDVADGAGIPLVLEWNASEVWPRRHWSEPMPLSGLFDSLLADMERTVVKGAGLIAAVSDVARDMALEVGAPEDRVIVAPNASDAEAIARQVADCPPRGAADPLIGWVGSFGPWHGAEVLIRALARLPDGYCLRMVGDGSGRTACEALADELGIRSRIEFRKKLPHDVVLRELAGCDLLASPHVPLPGTPFFGSPTKLFEYMALGRPIVASRLDQIGEVLEDGVTARLVAPGDEDELAGALRHVWELPDHGAALGVKARCAALADHTWKRRAEQILAALGQS
jgi:glycosyltransferase involved in cell wall biosynthesis